MEPTLHPADYILVFRPPKKILLGRGLIRREAIIVFAASIHSGETKHLFVKRVAAREGDTIRIESGRVLINNVAQGDVSAIYPNVGARRLDSWPSGRLTSGGVHIGPGNLFVLGDNRLSSTDSRSFGTITATQVEGIAVLCFHRDRAFSPSLSRLD